MKTLSWLWNHTIAKITGIYFMESCGHKWCFWKWIDFKWQRIFLFKTNHK